MVEEGVVSEVKDGKLIVRIKRHSACGVCKGCSMAEDRDMRIEFRNEIGAKEGERVKVELDDLIILKGSFLFYVVPLLGLMFGLFIGKLCAKRVDLVLPDELLSTIFGIIIMLVIYIATRKYSLLNKKRFKPRVTKIG